MGNSIVRERDGVDVLDLRLSNGATSVLLMALVIWPDATISRDELTSPNRGTHPQLRYARLARQGAGRTLAPVTRPRIVPTRGLARDVCTIRHASKADFAFNQNWETQDDNFRQSPPRHRLA